MKQLPRMSRKKTLTIAAACMMSFVPSIAQEDDDFDLGALFDLKLETGSFLALEKSASPVSMTIIDKDKVNRSGARTLSDLLEIYVPSFQYMYNQWICEIWAMRGVTADFNNKIIFLVNGVKMNLQARNGAYTEINLGLFGDIERVEVLEGPAGMVYGSGSIAGVVNIVTKKAGQESSGDVTIAANNKSWSVEGNSHARINKNTSIIMSGGYRWDGGLGEGKSRMYGYQDWPQGQTQSDWGPSKGSHGKTPGNMRIGMDMEWKEFSLYSRVTRQQHSTASLFGRFPWDDNQRNYVDPASASVVLDITDGTYSTTIDGEKIALGKFLTESAAIEAAKNTIEAHNAKYFGDVEIDGKTYSYKDFLANKDLFMTQSRNSNQTRRFITDNVAAELKYEKTIGANKVTVKVGVDANQCISKFENNGFNREIPDGSTGYTSPDYTWSSFGEKRYSIQALYNLSSVDKLQSVIGGEYRLDDIGNDFMGRNMAFGSESKHVVTPVQYNNLALFTENYYSFNDMFSALVGIRFDKHTRTSGIVSPKIALITKLNKNNTIKIFGQMASNNGSAYAYEFNENHYNFAGEIGQTQLKNGKKYVDNNSAAVVIVPTKEELNSLKPEKSTSIELVTDHKFFDQAVTVSPSVSYNMMRDNFTWNSAVQRNMNMGDYNAIVANLTTEFTTKNVSIGMHNTLQRPVNTDNTQKATLNSPIIVKVEKSEVASEGLDASKTWYKLDPTKTETKEYSLIKEALTYDSEHFLNIASYTTKLYADVKPLSWLGLNANARIFWGYPGRAKVNNEVFAKYDDKGNLVSDPKHLAAQANANYLSIDGNDGILKSTILKLNASAHFYLPQGFTISVLGTNLTGKPDNNNAVRLQQMVNNEVQRNLYTVDLPNWELRIMKEF